MQKINYKNGVFNWEKQNGDEVDFIRNFEICKDEEDNLLIEAVDDNMVLIRLKHLRSSAENPYSFIGGDTEINGVVCQNSNEIINQLTK